MTNLDRLLHQGSVAIREILFGNTASTVRIIAVKLGFRASQPRLRQIENILDHYFVNWRMEYLQENTRRMNRILNNNNNQWFNPVPVPVPVVEVERQEVRIKLLISKEVFDPDSAVFCGICLEDSVPRKDIIALHCKHEFCGYCIVSTLKTVGNNNPTCALCRRDMTALITHSADMKKYVKDNVK